MSDQTPTVQVSKPKASTARFRLRTYQCPCGIDVEVFGEVVPTNACQCQATTPEKPISDLLITVVKHTMPYPQA